MHVKTQNVFNIEMILVLVLSFCEFITFQLQCVEELYCHKNLFRSANCVMFNNNFLSSVYKKCGHIFLNIEKIKRCLKQNKKIISSDIKIKIISTIITYKSITHNVNVAIYALQQLHINLLLTTSI